MLTMLPVALILGGCLALINIWLSIRVGQVRTAEKVMVGDGGNDRVIRRMHAHANFAENALFVLALVGLIEFTAGTSIWLEIAAALFVLGRIGHAFGMDGWMPGRMGGTIVTMLLQLALGIWAIALPIVGHYAHKGDSGVEVVAPSG